MQIRKFKVWKATAAQDERGGREKLVGHYYCRSDADDDVVGQAFWGADGRVESNQIDVIEVKDGDEILTFPRNAAITVYYKNRVRREEEKAQLRAAGLAKLTAEEKEALGIK